MRIVACCGFASGSQAPETAAKLKIPYESCHGVASDLVPRLQPGNPYLRGSAPTKRGRSLAAGIPRVDPGNEATDPEPAFAGVTATTVQRGKPRNCHLLGAVETSFRPARAMLEAAVFQPSRDCERALRQQLNRRKAQYYTSLRSSVV